MARSPQNLERLAKELAALTPEERAKVLQQAEDDEKFKPWPKDFKIPLLKLGGPWTGGNLRREDLYDDDGR